MDRTGAPVRPNLPKPTNPLKTCFFVEPNRDNHAYAYRPCWVLPHFDDAPQLPFGYAAMILISYVPPLWFALMNPRLKRWKARAYQISEIRAVVKQFA